MFHLSNWSYRKLLYAGLAVYALAAWYSVGYHHPDEHFQILEFAGYKSGITPAADMPWEFRDKIRPALQPTLALGFIKIWNAFGIVDPFIQTFLMRLCSGMVACLLFLRLSRLLARDFAEEPTARLLLGATVFLWFMPYLSVRFSSENWAALAFLGGVYGLLQIENVADRRANWYYLAAGIMLGLSFFFRFQMAFAIAGVAGWMLFQKRVKLLGFILFALGGLASLAIGVAIDFWFYGAPVFTPWEYFQSNILHDKASEYGVSPWWFYIPEFIVRAIPPISLVLLGLAGLGGFKKRNHVFTWALIPFLIAHIAVAHKEMRFLFPMAFPFLFLACQGWENWKGNYGGGKFTKIIVRICVMVNVLVLVFVCTQPAQESINYYRFLYQYTKDRPRILYAEGESPYRLVGLNTHFYETPALEVRTLTDFSDLADSSGFKLQDGDLLLSRRLVLEPVLPGYKLKRIYTHFPDWMLWYNINNWQERTRIWSVYEVMNDE